MADTIGIKLEGVVSLRTFAETMQQFHALVRAITSEVAGPNSIVWEIDELSAGSAYASVRGVPLDDAEPARVVAAYGRVGQALAANTVVPYAVAVGERANELMAVAADGEVTLVRFFVAGEEVAAVAPVAGMAVPVGQPYVLGAIVGVVETIARRPRFRIVVYDDLFDHAVSCYLSAEQAEQARSVWGKRVMVSGRIFRDAETGRPTAVRDVFKIQVVEVSGEDHRSARGILPWHPGDEPAEFSIRRLRDA